MASRSRDKCPVTEIVNGNGPAHGPPALDRSGSVVLPSINQTIVSDLRLSEARHVRRRRRDPGPARGPAALPGELPLRQHLAETLLGLGRPEEAEKEFREALALAPDDADAQARPGQRASTSRASTGARPGHRRGPGHEGPGRPRAGLLLHARLLFRGGRGRAGRRQYRRAVEADPTVADAEFAERLGIRIRGREQRRRGGRPTRTWSKAGSASLARTAGDGASDVEVERPKVTFADVGGMEALKEEIRMKIIHPLEHPELYKAYGKAIGGGILMYGPPGCGKTYLARATAGEIQAGLPRRRHQRRARHVDRQQRAEPARAVRAGPAQHARACCSSTRSTPSAASRADMRHSGGRQLINQFLAETGRRRSAQRRAC